MPAPRLRGREAPASRRCRIQRVAHTLVHGGSDLGARHAAARPLLQQQFGRFDQRVGVEAGPHDPVERGIGDGNDGHALMVRHEGAHDRDRLPLRHPRPA